MNIDTEKARELLAAPSGERPRIYAELKDGQRVKIPSLHYLELYAPDIAFVYLSSITSVRDMVREA